MFGNWRGEQIVVLNNTNRSNTISRSVSTYKHASSHHRTNPINDWYYRQRKCYDELLHASDFSPSRSIELIVGLELHRTSKANRTVESLCTFTKSTPETFSNFDPANCLPTSLFWFPIISDCFLRLRNCVKLRKRIHRNRLNSNIK